jgi:predicted  nucleic acid-binding Zn-ribbon protein
MDQEIKQQFDDLKQFIVGNVALASDLQEVKTEVTELRSDVRVIQTSVDNLAKQVLTFQQEMAVMTMRVSRMESWIMAASQKIGVPYQQVST